MNKKALIPLVAGLGVGGFALKMVFDTLQKAKGAQVSTVMIWAAKNDIPRGTRIAEEMLTKVEFPVSSVPPGAFKETDKDKLVGRVPRLSAPGNLPILSDMLLEPGASAGLNVPPGYRAVAVKIDESSGVNNMLQPGAHVDVVGYFTINNGLRQQTIARTVIENVEVGAVGTQLVGGSEVKNKEEEKQPARAAILFVEPDKVPILHLAEQSGKIKLSMRNSQESSNGQLVSAMDNELTGQRPENAGKGILSGLFANWGKKSPPTPTTAAPSAADPEHMSTAAPAKPRVPTWDVYVWQGPKMEVVRFENVNSSKRCAPVEPTDPSSSTPKPAASATGAKDSKTTDAPKSETDQNVDGEKSSSDSAETNPN